MRPLLLKQALSPLHDFVPTSPVLPVQTSVPVTQDPLPTDCACDVPPTSSTLRLSTMPSLTQENLLIDSSLCGQNRLLFTTNTNLPSTQVKSAPLTAALVPRQGGSFSAPAGYWPEAHQTGSCKLQMLTVVLHGEGMVL